MEKAEQGVKSTRPSAGDEPEGMERIGTAIQNFFLEQCRGNYLLQQILEELKKLNAKGERKKAEKKVGGDLGPIAKMWNELREGLDGGSVFPEVVGMDPNGQRAKSAKARWEAKPDPRYWAMVISKVHASRFCKGDNTRKWIANFDWLVRPDTAVSILEGKYDDKKGQAPKGGIDL